MNFRLVLILGVLVPFTAYSLWVVGTLGPVEFLRQAHATPAGMQVLIDLVIALTLVLIWIRSDTKTTGIPFAPYLVATLLLGSIGPLGYLVHREIKARRAAGVGRPATA